VAARGRPGAGTNQEAIRRHNLGTVLAHLHRHGQLSRSELTARMGLNRSTIAALVGELEALGAVRQTAPSGARAGVGRPSLDVRPDPARVHVLACEVRVEGITVARVGLGGVVLDRTDAPTPTSRTPEHIAAQTAALMQSLAAESAPVGIGVSVPGIVSQTDGLVRSAPNLDWTDAPFARLLNEALGAAMEPVVANDADLGAWAEHARGQHDNLVFLNGDVGVGGGLVAAGAPLRGAGGYAGEVGHVTVTPGGRMCRCGSRGCWETEVGTAAIASALGHADAADQPALVRRLREVGQPPPELARVGAALGQGLASVINMLNPERIVLGGILGDLYRAVQEATDEALREAALLPHHQQAAIVLPCLGRDTILLGAAELAFQDLFEDPVAVLTAAVAS